MARRPASPPQKADPMSYSRFAAIIARSTVVMFGLMYLNTWAFDHVFYSQTRTWMALLMGAVMAIIMLGFMGQMYRNTTANLAILGASVLVFAASLWLVRSQDTVSDIAYMKAMIPHHSIAVMTSDRAHIRDPRVRKLADSILDAQVREIGEMKALIADLEAHPTPSNAPDLPPKLVGQWSRAWDEREVSRVARDPGPCRASAPGPRTGCQADGSVRAWSAAAKPSGDQDSGQNLP